MASQIQLRRDTAANWSSVNPVLAQGEPGVETDAGGFKIGDGVTPWNNQPIACPSLGLSIGLSIALG